MVITLIGYRGTGKSSIAPALASRLGWSWCDADVELERRASRSIREIFDSAGEPEFRRLERDVLVSLLLRDRLVLAAGGGAILDPRTRADFQAGGPVIWLQAAVATISARLDADAQTARQRPSLTGTSVLEEISTVLQAREPLYRATASIVVPTDQRSLAAIVEEIMMQLPAEVWTSERPLPGAPE